MRISNLLGLSVLSAILAASPVITASSPARVNVAVSIRIGPPVLPVYAQPICPEPGYIWAPGYWAYGDGGYFWVPGMWVLPPRVGLLWTPGYWAFDDGFYIWHAGYWGATVGFYGGIDYGFGYPGTGFYGGYWRGGEYFYNTRVTNVNTTIIRNVYNTPFANEHAVSRVSFNGGPHGIHAQPTPAELSAARASHVAMTRTQLQHQKSASINRTMLASVNHGRPDVAATARHEPRNAKPVTETNNSKGRSTANERHTHATPAPSHSVAPTHAKTPTHNAAPPHTVSPTGKTHSPRSSSSHSAVPAPAPSHTTTHNPAPPKPAATHNGSRTPHSATPASHSAKTEHAQPTHPSSHATVTEHPRPTKTEKPQPRAAPTPSQPTHTQPQSKPEHTQQPHASAPRSAPPDPAESPKPEHSQH
jgi:WXXGXW repeat (2 copies)